MKLFIPLLFLLNLLWAPSLSSNSSSFFTDISFSDELNLAENLATSTGSESFQQIASLIQDFKECTEQLTDDEENKELACKLIILADALYSEIKRLNLNSYFSDDFLSELHFLSSIAQKSQTLTAP